MMESPFLVHVCAAYNLTFVLRENCLAQLNDILFFDVLVYTFYVKLTSVRQSQS